MKRSGFTLVELLAVIAVTALLITLIVPALAAMRARGSQGQCMAHIRQLYVANTLYAAEHGHYVAAAADIHGSNRERWHGRRSSAGEPFDGTTGPLSPYLGHDRQVRRCAGFRPSAASQNAFEASCGGYGYNDRGVGSQVYLRGDSGTAMAKGMRPHQIARPERTIMFADAAFPQPYGRPTHVIEYSFAEAYHFVGVGANGQAQEYGRAMPSIHFRHNGHASVAWCNGRVSSEKLRTEYNRSFSEWQIGWPGGPDNNLFRP